MGSKIVFILLIFNTYLLFSQSSINLRAELTEEVFQEFDTYIRKYAPADSAFNAVIALSNKHFVMKRAAVSSYILNLYKPLFPARKIMLENETKTLELIMLSQTPSADMFSLYIDFINRKAPNDDAFFALQRIADFYIMRKEWDSTAMIYNSFRPLFPQLENKIDKTIKLLLSKEEGLEIKNLGNNLNTQGSEWDPSPTIDGRFLYFTADHRSGGYGNSDIWVSESKDGIWQKPQNIGRPINNQFDETVDNVTSDGTGLLISGNFRGSYGEYDIYLAERDSNGWKDLLHYSEPINSKYHDESGCISSDGNALFFTSDRPGGIGPFIPVNQYFYGGNTMGNMDIYVSVKTEKGWSEPINLGPVINTPYSERAAYLHPDGRSLYFSSNGHYGLGRLDVYKSVRLSDTSWTEWSEPVNLGKEINSAQDDWGYVVSLDGDIAFFAKDGDVDGFGNWDIYSITLPEIAKPDNLVTIKGYVKDSAGRAIECRIIWEDLETGKQVGMLRSDPRDGYYLIALPTGKNYGYYASRDGYYPSSKNLDLSNIQAKKTINQDIILTSVKDMQEKGSKVRINNIFYDYNKSELKESSIPELNRLLNFAKMMKKFNIIIEGHTDNIGSDNFNRNLSLKRAESVAEFLIKGGIDTQRIITQGFGSSKPLAPNDTEQNKSMNRRVEIRLSK